MYEDEYTIYTYDNITDFDSQSLFVHDLTNQTKTMEDVLQMQNQYQLTYYCQNNTCFEYDSSYDMVRISDENNISKLIITHTFEPRAVPDSQGAYSCNEGACLFLGCTHASQCLFGSCVIEDSHTGTIHEVPFNDHTVGLCRYDEEYNITECDAVYVKRTVFRNYRSYMHCGKLDRAPCKTNSECAYDLCTDGSCITLSGGPSDSDESLIYVLYVIVFMIALGFIALYVCYCCCYIHMTQHRKKILAAAAVTTLIAIWGLIKFY